MKTYLLLLISINLISCGTTKKDISSHLVKNDSTAEHSIIKEGVSSTESSSVHQKDSSFNNDIVLIFENEDDHLTTGDMLSTLVEKLKEDPVQKGIELAGTQRQTTEEKKGNPKTGHPSGKQYNYNIGGTPVTSNVPIKSATLHNAGKVTDLAVTTLKTKDSGQLQEHDKTHVVAVKKDSEKHVTRSGWPWWLWALIIITSAGTYLSIANKKSWFPFGHILWTDEEQNFKHKS